MVRVEHHQSRWVGPPVQPFLVVLRRESEPEPEVVLDGHMWESSEESSPSFEATEWGRIRLTDESATLFAPVIRLARRPLRHVAI